MKFDVDKIANLARLELTDDEKTNLRYDMEKIVNYMGMLSELELDDIEPTTHAVLLTNIVRDDVEGRSFSRDDMLDNAPATVDDELIKVPQVIEG